MLVQCFTTVSGVGVMPGIGSYLDQLTRALEKPGLTVTQVTFNASGHDISVTYRKGIRDIGIPVPYYARNRMCEPAYLPILYHYSVYLLQSYIDPAGRPGKGIDTLIEAFHPARISTYQDHCSRERGYDGYPPADGRPGVVQNIFYRFFGKNGLSRLYCAADIGVVPLLYEEFGYVPLETMMWEDCPKQSETE